MALYSEENKIMMPKWMECTWRRVPCDKGNCRICGKIKKDREQHIVNGEDPDSMGAIIEDVSNTFKEALATIKKDAEAKGFNITNIDDIQEPPKPKEFSLYNKIKEWHDGISKIIKEAEEVESFWLNTEEAADLSWYNYTVIAKTYRQLCNRWHIENKDDYGNFDYEYTKYVLEECFKILKNSLSILSKIDSNEKGKLILSLMHLPTLEKDILEI